MSAITELTVGIISTLLTAVGLFWTLFTYVVPHLREVRKKREIEEKRSMGPYTKNIIDDAARYYVRPKGSKSDPTHTFGKVDANSRELDLFDEVEKFIDGDERKKFLLVLADSGMGKTSFVLNYYFNNKKKTKRKKRKIKLVSLSIPDADAYLVGDDIDYENTIVFLDAFDEDTKAINDYQQRLLQLFRLCFRYKKVIVTCRSQFFVKESDIPESTNIPRIGPVYAGSRKQYEIQKLYLLPFDAKDIKAYLEKRFPTLKQDKKAVAMKIVSKMPSLSMRPMLLAYIPELLETDTAARNTFSLFEIIIEGWLERESVWVDRDLLREFSERLAVDIYRNRESRGGESIKKDELVALSDKWNLKIDNWKLTGRSLLNRDANDNYKFAHRSIMEFLYIKRLLKMDSNCYWIEITDQMRIFISEYLQWNERTKLLLHNRIKFLSANLFWKIVEMHQNRSDEKYFEFGRVFDGINFLNLTGYFLTGLESQRSGRALEISNVGEIFDGIIERERFNALSCRKYFSDPLELDIFTPDAPSEELFASVVKLLGKRLNISESSVKNALLRKANNKVYLQRLRNYLEVFGDDKTELTPVSLLIENLDLYTKGAIAVPIFNKENIFMHYVILTFDTFGQNRGF